MQSPLTILRTTVVEHPSFDAVINEIRGTIDDVGAGTAPLGCHSVLGPPNVGKSTLIEMLMVHYPRVPDGCSGSTDGCSPWTADKVPVLCLKMPAAPRVMTVLRALLKEIGDPKPNTGKEEELRSRLDNYIRRCGIQAIVFDDAQRAVDRLGRITQDNLAELLKDLFDDHGIAIVLVGLPRTRQLFAQDGQFDRRFLSELSFDPYRWGALGRELKEEAGRLAFMGTVGGLAQACLVPLAESVDVASEEVALRFFYASLGLVGRLKMLLLIALRQAQSSQATTIDMGALESAFEKAFRTGGALSTMENPFSEGWVPKLPPAVPGDPKPAARRDPTRIGRRKSERRAVAQAALSPS